jgi:predicted secreted hydrolase
MGHLAVADVAGKRFYAHERYRRAALGLAGARTHPFRVWLEDWSIEGQGPDALPVRLRAAHDAIAIDLLLDSAKPPVLQGDRGLSQKSAEPGNASYYYSLTRMTTRGILRVGNERFEVSGLSWMDREWSTSALAEHQVGWDWFALQLSDGREVMFYRLRRRDGSVDPVSAGTLVDADGEAQRLSNDHVQLEVLDRWDSRSGVRYPSRWRLRIPQQALDLTIAPYFADQELNLSVRYWEGAVKIEGTSRGQPLRGRGYVELTGYGDER